VYLDRTRNRAFGIDSVQATITDTGAALTDLSGVEGRAFKVVESEK